MCVLSHDRASAVTPPPEIQYEPYVSEGGVPSSLGSSPSATSSISRSAPPAHKYAFSPHPTTTARRAFLIPFAPPVQQAHARRQHDPQAFGHQGTSPDRTRTRTHRTHTRTPQRQRVNGGTCMGGRSNGDFRRPTSLCRTTRRRPSSSSSSRRSTRTSNPKSNPKRDSVRPFA